MPPITVKLGDFSYILPEIVLTTWGLLVLIVDFALLRRTSGPRRQLYLGAFSLAGALLTIVVGFLPMMGVSTTPVPSEDVFNAALPALEGSDAATATATATPTASVAEQAGGGLRALLFPDTSEADPSVFFGTVAGDQLTRWFNILIAALLGLVIGLSMAWEFTEHWGEYFALLFWSAVGMMLLIAAEELLTLFLTLEMMTICLYLTASFEKDRRRSAEGGLKYFVYGSVSSALFLFGLSLIYGLTGTTRLDAIQAALLPSIDQVRDATGQFRNVGRVTGLVTPVAVGAGTRLAPNIAGITAVLLVMVGFGFKIAAVPFHQWAPDAYEGAPAPVTAWIASGSKVASVVALMKVLLHALGPWSREPGGVLSPGWGGFVAVVAALSMTYGNFAALAQRNFKRMLAYSSIAHAGYMLVGVLAVAAQMTNTSSTRPAEEAAGSALFYLVVYALSTVGAFAVAAWLARDRGRDDIDDLNGLGFRSPGLAVCVVALMLSLIGVPPMAGFFGKLYMFMEALNAEETGRLSLTWLVALALFNSVVSAFYYVRVLKAMFLRQPDRSAMAPASRSIAWPIVLSTLAVVALGLYPRYLQESMAQAALPMLTSGGQGAMKPQAEGQRPSDKPGPPKPPHTQAELDAYFNMQKEAKARGKAAAAAEKAKGGAVPKAKAGPFPKAKGDRPPQYRGGAAKSAPEPAKSAAAPER